MGTPFLWRLVFRSQVNVEDILESLGTGSLENLTNHDIVKDEPVINVSSL